MTARWLLIGVVLVLALVAVGLQPQGNAEPDSANRIGKLVDVQVSGATYATRFTAYRFQRSDGVTVVWVINGGDIVLPFGDPWVAYIEPRTAAIRVLPEDEFQKAHPSAKIR
jgi:hypothetical protein